MTRPQDNYMQGSDRSDALETCPVHAVENGWKWRKLEAGS